VKGRKCWAWGLRSFAHYQLPEAQGAGITPHRATLPTLQGQSSNLNLSYSKENLSCIRPVAPG
jgi:hypothetical protein